MDAVSLTIDDEDDDLRDDGDEAKEDLEDGEIFDWQKRKMELVVDIRFFVVIDDEENCGYGIVGDIVVVVGFMLVTLVAALTFVHG